MEYYTALKTKDWELIQQHRIIRKIMVLAQAAITTYYRWRTERADMCFSQFWRLKIQGLGACRFGSWKGPNLALQPAAFSLYPHMAFFQDVFGGRGGSDLCLLMKALISWGPILTASSKPSRLPRTPAPDTTKVRGEGFNKWVWGDTAFSP